MCNRPSVTRNTLRGSAFFVSLSQVERPVKSLPLKSRISTRGRIGCGRSSPRAATAIPRARAVATANQECLLMDNLLSTAVDWRAENGDGAEKAESHLLHS